MSDLTLEAYAQDLIADVLATAEAESTTTPETFTRRALDDLEQAGVTENTFTAYYRAHGIEVSGYGSNESLGSARRVRQLLPPVPARRQDAPGRGRDAAPPGADLRPAVPRRPPAGDRRILRRLRHVPRPWRRSSRRHRGSGCSC